MIYFIKTVSYKNRYTLKKYTYDFLCKLSLQKVDPKPLVRYPVDNSFDVVLCSSLQRVKQSILSKVAIPVVELSELNEILFDLEKMVKFDLWKNNGSVAVRKRFKEFFIKDLLPQKRVDIFRQVKHVLCFLDKKYKNKNVLVMSHSFKLKIFEAFIKTKGKIRTCPELIHEFIFDNRKTFDFGKGFCIEHALIDKKF